MHFEEFSIAWPFFVAFLISGGMVVKSKSLKRSSTTLFFTLCVSAASLWSFFAGLHLISPGFEAKVFWSDLTYVGIAPLPVAWILLALSYSGNRSSIPTKTIALLCVIPTITMLLVVTNGMHHWIFGAATPLNTSEFSSFSRYYGPWFWMHTAYSYALILLGIGLFTRSMFDTKGHFRKQALIMLVGSLIPLVFNALYLSNENASIRLDYTPVAFAATGAVYFIGLFKYKMLDLMPIARAEIVRFMEDAVIVTDIEGFILDTNEAALRLRPSESGSEIGRHMDVEYPFIHLEKSASDVEFRSHQEIQFASEPDEIWYRVDSKTIQNSNGQPEGRLFVLRDISAEKRLERQRQEAMRKSEELSLLKSAFLSNMSHDVRTPLAGIIGLADVLVEECTGDQLEFAEMIRDSGNRLFKLLNSMLSVAHLSSGTLDQNAENTDLTTLSRRVTSIVEREIKQKNINFEISLPDEVMEAELDPNYLTHALALILDCSVHFTDSGRIGFELQKDDQELVFEVSDTGRGFDPAFLRSINERLNVKEMADLGLDKGSGLGLRVAHGLIEEMGGHMSIQSELGAGSSFTIRLPLAWTPHSAHLTGTDRLPMARSKTTEAPTNPVQTQ